MKPTSCTASADYMMTQIAEYLAIGTETEVMRQFNRKKRTLHQMNTVLKVFLTILLHGTGYPEFFSNIIALLLLNIKALILSKMISKL